MSAAPSSAPRAAGQALPQLTGIRAVAFLMVFLFHAQFGSYYLWSGVDLFFVLSGYLITGILLAQRGRPGYFRSFYLSRVLRIFPPFYLVLLLVVLAFGAVRPGQLAATAGFAANLYLPLADRVAVPPSYWALAPYWSLALEEQFYLLWPLLVLRLNPRQLAWTCAALVLAAPLIRVLTLYRFPGGASVETIYMLPFDRLDLLAGGALIALCRELRLLRPETLARLGLWLAGLGLVLLAALGKAFPAYYHQSADSVLFTGLGYSNVCLIMCGLILHLANAERGPMVRLLSQRAVVYLGTISYTTYLVHYAFIILLAERFGMSRGWGLTGASLALTVGFAAASWHLMEQPIKRYKNRRIGEAPAVPLRAGAAPDDSAAPHKL